MVRPFSSGQTARSLLEAYLAYTVGEIAKLETEYVLKTPASELERYFTEQATIEPLVLGEPYMEDPTNTSIDVSGDPRRFTLPGERTLVPGTRVTVVIPYTGEERLWQTQPSTFSTSYPSIEISHERVAIDLSFANDSADGGALKAEVERQLDTLRKAVQTLHGDVTNYNSTVEAAVSRAVQDRRDKALATSKAIESIGIPIRRRDEPLTYAAPVKRKPKIDRPAVSTEPYAPEPVLPDDEYEHILKVLQSMAIVIERNPGSFSKLGEEAIRDHCLLVLNGHYEGAATGETFNYGGKTDILIRVDDRNVFIAECKFWHGPKAFNEAIDQLLGYLSWRDCKASLVVFNKTKDSVAVMKKMHEVMEQRPELQKTLANSRYVLVRDGRDILVTTMLFDVPGS